MGSNQYSLETVLSLRAEDEVLLFVEGRDRTADCMKGNFRHSSSHRDPWCLWQYQE